jgi:hypothetical protein
VRIGTKGVVALFNAVDRQQRALKKLDEGSDTKALEKTKKSKTAGLLCCASIYLLSFLRLIHAFLCRLCS